MDCVKVGKLILKLRTEQGMTQKQLAEKMNLSDKTISKWERGLGCPDISLLKELASILNVDAVKLLSGDLGRNDRDSGNMSSVKFYFCPDCGNVIWGTGKPDIMCCGRKLSEMKVAPADVRHSLNVIESDGEWYITSEHEMTKSHYLLFIAYASSDKLLFTRLYPEQDVSVRLPKMRDGKMYFACNRDGLFLIE